MLYKKNQAEKLEDSLFKQPTAEYRGAPFWAWNTRLEQKELDRQMEVLKSMGFGGAHLHPRTGLETPYLSEELLCRLTHLFPRQMRLCCGAVCLFLWIFVRIL